MKRQDLPTMIKRGILTLIVCMVPTLVSAESYFYTLTNGYIYESPYSLKVVSNFIKHQVFISSYGTEGGFIRLFDTNDGVRTIGFAKTEQGFAFRSDYPPDSKDFKKDLNEKMDKEFKEWQEIEKKKREEAEAKHREEEIYKRRVNNLYNLKIGMKEDAVIKSCGKPFEVNQTVASWGTDEQWIYVVYGHNVYLYFRNGILKSMQRPTVK